VRRYQHKPTQGQFLEIKAVIMQNLCSNCSKLPFFCCCVKSMWKSVFYIYLLRITFFSTFPFYFYHSFKFLLRSGWFHTTHIMKHISADTDLLSPVLSMFSIYMNFLQAGTYTNYKLNNVFHTWVKVVYINCTAIFLQVKLTGLQHWHLVTICLNPVTQMYMK
jgi:hypothetical protein